MLGRCRAAARPQMGLHLRRSDAEGGGPCRAPALPCPILPPSPSGPTRIPSCCRLLSCFPADKPIRILTTGSEFMSFTRQTARFEEDGHGGGDARADRALRHVRSALRRSSARRAGTISSSSARSSSIPASACAIWSAIVKAVPDDKTLVVIDGYHGFMAVPTDLSRHRAARLLSRRRLQIRACRAKASASCTARRAMCRGRATPAGMPGFTALSGGKPAVQYGEDGSRFLGATFDVSGLYRFNAVQDWLVREGLTVANDAGTTGAGSSAPSSRRCGNDKRIAASQLMVPDEGIARALPAFRTEEAGAITADLLEKNIIVDFRGDRLRFGFGIYHSEDDARAVARGAGALARRSQRRKRQGSDLRFRRRNRHPAP